MTRCPSVWCSNYYFFHNSLQQLFQFISLFFINLQKWKYRVLSVLSLQEIIIRNNAWKIRRLINESFVPAHQQPNILYLRLSYFWCFILYAGLRWWFLKDFFSSFEQQATADDVRLIEAWLIMEGPILHNVPIILILFKQQDLKIQGLHLCKDRFWIGSKSERDRTQMHILRPSCTPQGKIKPH